MTEMVRPFSEVKRTMLPETRDDRLRAQVARLEAERDAAIGRGKYLYHQLGAYCAVLFAPDERLEAAEALVLRIHKVCKHTLEGDRSYGWYKMVVFDIGQLTTPAEAQGRQAR